MREMLSAAKRPKKNALFELYTEKTSFGGEEKSGILVFIEAWYLSTRLARRLDEKVGTLNTNINTVPSHHRVMKSHYFSAQKTKKNNYFSKS